MFPLQSIIIWFWLRFCFDPYIEIIKFIKNLAYLIHYTSKYCKPLLQLSQVLLH
jgi:hypothetical protein